jgi:uncharacterized protein YegP (UPF0339 family)
LRAVRPQLCGSIEKEGRMATRKRYGEVFRDEAGKWRWRVIAGNGRIVASSGEAFYDLDNAARALGQADVEFDEYRLAQE